MKRPLLAATISSLLAAPLAAQDHRTGARIESRAAMETPVFSGEPTGGKTFGLGNGLTLGFEGGYDLAIAEKIVAGPYVTYEVSDLQNCDGTDCIWSQDNVAGGLHMAYLRGEKTLYYAKLGYARLGLGAQVRGRDFRDAGGGVQAAFGYEHGFGQNLYLRLEAAYADQGRIFAVDFERYSSTVAVGWRF